MNENPYQSPAVANTGKLSSRVSLWRLWGFGFWAGSLVGSTFGSGGGVLLAGSFVIFQLAASPENSSPFPETIVTIVSAAAILGAMAGLLAGCIVGPLVASVAWLCGAPSRRLITWLAVGLSAVVGLGLGWFAARAGAELAGVGTAGSLLSLVVGTGAGLGGGYQLARGLNRFVAPRIPRDTLECGATEQ